MLIRVPLNAISCCKLRQPRSPAENKSVRARRKKDDGEMGGQATMKLSRQSQATCVAGTPRLGLGKELGLAAGHGWTLRPIRQGRGSPDGSVSVPSELGWLGSGAQALFRSSGGGLRPTHTHTAERPFFFLLEGYRFLTPARRCGLSEGAGMPCVCPGRGGRATAGAMKIGQLM